MRWRIATSEPVDLRETQARMGMGTGPGLAQGGHDEGKKEEEGTNNCKD